MGNKLTTFIDTNILLYIFTYQKQDVFQWIEELYDTIYVHKDVLEELNSQKSKEIIEEKIKSDSKWMLFDPEDENRLTDDEYTIYLEIYNEIRRQFTEYKQLRLHKDTTDYGDIGILAGCLFLETTIITSHDSDFKQVIQINDLKISFGKEEISDEEIVIHDLLVLGNQLIQQKICRRSEYRKFIKAILGKNSFDIIDRQLII